MGDRGAHRANLECLHAAAPLKFRVTDTEEYPENVDGLLLNHAVLGRNDSFA